MYLAGNQVGHFAEDGMVSDSIAVDDVFQRNLEEELTLFDRLVCNQSTPNIVSCIANQSHLQCQPLARIKKIV